TVIFRVALQDAYHVTVRHEPGHKFAHLLEIGGVAALLLLARGNVNIAVVHDPEPYDGLRAHAGGPLRKNVRRQAKRQVWKDSILVAVEACFSDASLGNLVAKAPEVGQRQGAFNQPSAHTAVNRSHP